MFSFPLVFEFRLDLPVASVFLFYFSEIMCLTFFGVSKCV